MNEQQIAAIEARASKATPGPWFYNSYSAVYSAVCAVSGVVAPGCYPAEGTPDYHDEEHCTPFVASVPVVAGDTATKRGSDDAWFIAGARADVPALCAEARRLRAVLDRARTALIAIRDPFWLPPNVVEEIDRHLGAIETALGEQP